MRLIHPAGQLPDYPLECLDKHFMRNQENPQRNGNEDGHELKPPKCLAMLYYAY